MTTQYFTANGNTIPHCTFFEKCNWPSQFFIMLRKNHSLCAFYQRLLLARQNLCQMSKDSRPCTMCQWTTLRFDPKTTTAIITTAVQTNAAKRES